MEHFQGRCYLDWWANSTTCLASIEVSLVARSMDSDRIAEGHLVSDDSEEREGFILLCDLDPVFVLRFDDESSAAVTVHPTREDGRFTLTVRPGPERRSVSHTLRT